MKIHLQFYIFFMLLLDFQNSSIEIFFFLYVRWIFHKFSFCSNLYEKLSKESQIYEFFLFSFLQNLFPKSCNLSLGHIISREGSKNSCSLRSTNKPTCKKQNKKCFSKEIVFKWKETLGGIQKVRWQDEVGRWFFKCQLYLTSLFGKHVNWR